MYINISYTYKEREKEREKEGEEEKEENRGGCFVEACGRGKSSLES